MMRPLVLRIALYRRFFITGCCRQAACGLKILKTLFYKLTTRTFFYKELLPKKSNHRKKHIIAIL
jgi:hypothetical protein